MVPDFEKDSYFKNDGGRVKDLKNAGGSSMYGERDDRGGDREQRGFGKTFTTNRFLKKLTQKYGGELAKDIKNRGMKKLDRIVPQDLKNVWLMSSVNSQTFSVDNYELIATADASKKKIQGNNE